MLLKPIENYLQTYNIILNKQNYDMNLRFSLFILRGSSGISKMRGKENSYLYDA